VKKGGLEAREVWRKRSFRFFDKKTGLRGGQTEMVGGASWVVWQKTGLGKDRNIPLEKGGLGEDDNEIVDGKGKRRDFIQEYRARKIAILDLGEKMSQKKFWVGQS